MGVQTCRNYCDNCGKEPQKETGEDIISISKNIDKKNEGLLSQDFSSFFKKNIAALGEYYKDDFYLIEKKYKGNNVKIPFSPPKEYIEKDARVYPIKAMKLSRGRVYKGYWNEELKPDGQGKLYVPDKHLFVEGIWKGGELKYGKIFFKDGYIFEGKMNNSNFDGKGILESKSDFRYEGDFKNGKMEGYGKLEGSNGDKYEGNFVDNKFDGKGKYTFYNLNFYEGEFNKGNRSGFGTYIVPNKFKFEGRWLDDKPNGEGKLTNNNETGVIKSTWKNGKIAEEPKYEKGNKDDFIDIDFNFNVDDIKYSKITTINIKNINP